MPIIIDGHNLLWSIRTPGEDSESLTDLKLCYIIGRYLKRIDETGEIVFDGKGPPDKSGFDNISNLEVLFSGLTTDADTVIEDKIKANSAPKRLIVVSSDRRVKDAARARKAQAIKSDVFWNNLQKQLKRKRIAKEPTAKQIGLSEGETDQWLKFLGLDQ